VKPVAPVVNSNGNTARSLIDSTMEVRSHVSKAMQALAESDLAHGRNYQTAKPGTHTQARIEHFDRLQALRKIADDMLDIALQIQN
jgi:hypothetical protein